MDNEYVHLSDYSVSHQTQQYYIDNKMPVNILEIPRREVLSHLSEPHTEWDQLDVDMVLEYKDELQDEGFDMNRIDDIEVVKEFQMENKLIFVQPGIEHEAR